MAYLDPLLRVSDTAIRRLAIAGSDLGGFTRKDSFIQFHIISSIQFFAAIKLAAPGFLADRGHQKFPATGFPQHGHLFNEASKRVSKVNLPTRWHLMLHSITSTCDTHHLCHILEASLTVKKQRL